MISALTTCFSIGLRVAHHGRCGTCLMWARVQRDMRTLTSFPGALRLPMPSPLQPTLHQFFHLEWDKLLTQTLPGRPLEDSCLKCTFCIYSLKCSYMNTMYPEHIHTRLLSINLPHPPSPPTQFLPKFISFKRITCWVQRLCSTLDYVLTTAPPWAGSHRRWPHKSIGPTLPNAFHHLTLSQPPAETTWQMTVSPSQQKHQTLSSSSKTTERPNNDGGYDFCPRRS